MRDRLLRIGREEFACRLAQERLDHPYLCVHVDNFRLEPLLARKREEARCQAGAAIDGMKPARDHLPDPRRIARGDALRDLGGIIGEDHRAEAVIVVLRYVAEEVRCVVGHDGPPVAVGERIAGRRSYHCAVSA